MHLVGWKLVSILTLLIAANGDAYALFVASLQPVLRVSVLDVGQGDAILIEGPTGASILIDGGPDRSVLRRLGEELGPFDRAIGLVIETHPDSDHIGGLPSVFEEYAVGGFMEPGFPPESDFAISLESAVEAEAGVVQGIARRGMRILLGGGAYADVLSPDRAVDGQDTNDGSVVLHLVYGDTSFMLTGDLSSSRESWLLQLDAEDGELNSTVLKAGHHGSKTSTSAEWLDAVSPDVVAISVGADNRYGHPSAETLDRIVDANAAILRTDENGTLHFISNGLEITER